MIEIVPNWHPIFVHFTVALFSVATGLYALSLLVSNVELKAQWRIVARWNLWFGMAISLITVLTGWYAYNTVAHDAPSHLAMTDHRNWALITVTLYLIVTAWSVIRHRAGKEASPLLFLILLIALSSLGSTAWRGGEVVYRYGLGVMSLPNTGQHAHMGEADEHGHDTAEGENSHGHAGADEDDGQHSTAVDAAQAANMPYVASEDTTQKSMVESPAMEQSSTQSGHHHNDSAPHSH